MQANRIAVIDLGSNTFHLLIVRRTRSSPGFEEIFRKRVYVYLAKGGLGEINPESFARGLETLHEFKQIIDRFKVATIRCVGTSALRTARNGVAFIDEVNHRLGLNIELISGEREAQLIFKGLKLFQLPENIHGLAIDIGGGSIEFIFFHSNTILFQHSIKIGISVINSEFKKSDPIEKDELEIIDQYLDSMLSLVKEHSLVTKPEFIVGASGPFEILQLLHEQKHDRLKDTSELKRDTVLSICEQIMHKTLAERYRIKGMPSARAELSVESMLLIRYFLLHFTSIRSVIISPYAMKEGIIVESLNLD